MDKIKKYINIGLSIILIVLVNILLIYNILVPIFIETSIQLSKIEALQEYPDLLDPFWDSILLYIFTIIHFFVLPAFYHLLKKYSKSVIIQYFIYKIRHSIKWQIIIILILILFSLIVENEFAFLKGTFFNEYLGFWKIFKSTIFYLLVSTFSDLYGSYLFLFIFWYIEKKIKHYIKTRAIKKLKDNSGKI